MRIAITAMGKDVSSKVDMRFGRAAYFMVYSEDNGTWQSADNHQNLNAVQGAGIQAAQNVAKLGADILITGNVGPKAFKVLQANNMKIYTTGESTVEEAYNAYKAGKLTLTNEATKEGHWM